METLLSGFIITPDNTYVIFSISEKENLFFLSFLPFLLRRLSAAGEHPVANMDDL